MSKMSLFNRALAVSLAGTMVLGMTACGSSGGSTSDGASSSAGDSTAASTQEAATTDTEAASSGASYDNPDFYPVSDSTVDMTAFTMSMPNVTDLATNDFTKYLENLTGVHLEFETGGRDDWEEKLNLELSSGDYPDIIFGVSPNLAKYGVKEGIIIPLDDLITEENCPNYLSMF